MRAANVSIAGILLGLVLDHFTVRSKWVRWMRHLVTLALLLTAWLNRQHGSTQINRETT